MYTWLADKPRVTNNVRHVTVGEEGLVRTPLIATRLPFCDFSIQLVEDFYAVFLHSTRWFLWLFHRYSPTPKLSSLRIHFASLQ